ncbi:alpha/beta fold hydrolase [Alkalihalobacillus sp. BA299]|uniref:alpha/beta fold hydrolase n=1 Tax=Alkalihalobacillus sp. BA299 TaxID=2815938 RepID=UPI0027DBF1C7|nr:alpha/beta fold hydrolase [Alkalihalobacillus sp. BA299]
MTTKTMETNVTPFSVLDYTKEWKRWNRFFNIMNELEAEPSVGHTLRQLVWKKNKSTLWYYPAVEKKYDVPLFFVYSLFNKPFILDLNPGSSIIEGLTKRGYDVYLLDWGTPGYEDKGTSLDDYIVDYLQKSVRRALRHSGAEEISVIGYCLGGTIASIYAAIDDEPIKNLIVATVPIDFSVQSAPDKWVEAIKNGDYNIDRLVEVYGNMPPAFVNAMFRSISAPVYLTPYVQLLTKAYDDKFVERWRRFNKWTKEHVPFTGEAFKQLSNDLGRDNKLVKGELTIRGKKVDLAKIKADLLVVSSKYDHLIPEEQSLPIMDLVASKDKTYQLVEAGHVSLALSGKFPVLLDEWLTKRSNSISK